MNSCIACIVIGPALALLGVLWQGVYTCLQDVLQVFSLQWHRFVRVVVTITLSSLFCNFPWTIPPLPRAFKLDYCLGGVQGCRGPPYGCIPGSYIFVFTVFLLA